MFCKLSKTGLNSPFHRMITTIYKFEIKSVAFSSNLLKLPVNISINYVE